jgi:hypothetical protein
MARLLIKTEGLGQQTLELRMGMNRVGRDPECEIFIEHPTISSRHCELALTNDGIYVHDCGSTNGTFVNGGRILESWLDAGQILRLGDVELLVESTEVKVGIPQFKRPSQIAPPPVVFADGAVACPQHDAARASYRCMTCKEVMCDACVRVLRRKGGKPHFLCVLCSHECEPIQITEPQKRKGFFGMLQDTVKLKFKHTVRR